VLAFKSRDSKDDLLFARFLRGKESLSLGYFYRGCSELYQYNIPGSR
jgi:hypothetical protein